LKITPDYQKTINAQIGRCQRNIRRASLFYLFTILSVTALIFSLLLKPLGFQKEVFINSFYLFIILSMVFLTASYLIYEQFSSPNELRLISVSFAASISLSSIISKTISLKLFRINKKKLLLAATVLGIALLFFISYISTFLISSHYLIIYKL